VALEVTGNAWEIARILEPHVAQVVVVSPSDTGIRQARARQPDRVRRRGQGVDGEGQGGVMDLAEAREMLEAAFSHDHGD